MDQQQIEKNRSRTEQCMPKLDDEMFEFWWARINLREYWLALKTDPGPLLAMSPDELETYVADQPQLQEYLRLLANAENATGSFGKHLNDKCEVDWSSVACVAWFFANNQDKLGAAAAGDASWMDTPINCPERLSDETGPGGIEKSSPWKWIGIASAGVIGVGLLALLLTGKKG